MKETTPPPSPDNLNHKPSEMGAFFVGDWLTSTQIDQWLKKSNVARKKRESR